MKHFYYLQIREGGPNTGVPEETIKALLFNREIVHVESGHVGRDDHMNHYFKVKVSR